MPSSYNLRRAVFLDRDGTINIDKIHLYRIEDWEWIEGAISLIRNLNHNGYLVVVATNQAGIARGLYSAEDVEKLHAYVQSQLLAMGARIDRFYFCPHHPDYGEKIICNCRKPNPGMLLRAAEEMNIDLSQSWFIGDKESDIIAGLSAGVRPVFLNHSLVTQRSLLPCQTVQNLAEVLKIIP